MRADIIKHAMHYGFYFGLYLCAKFFLSMTQNAFLGFLAFAMWVSIPFLIYWVVKKYREEQLQGFISFHNAWSLSFWMFFYGGLIVEVAQFIYYQFINTSFLPQSLQQSLQIMDKMGMSMPQQNLDMLEKIMTHPNLYVLTDFAIYTLVGGAIISLLIALAAKRKPNPFQ